MGIASEAIHPEEEMAAKRIVIITKRKAAHIKPTCAPDICLLHILHWEEDFGAAHPVLLLFLTMIKIGIRHWASTGA